MSADFCAITTIAAMRKARHCFWCHAALPVGSQSVKVVAKTEGFFWAVYVHPDCNAAWLRDPCNEEGEGCPYDHLRGCTCNETTEAEEARQHATEATP